MWHSIRHMEVSADRTPCRHAGKTPAWRALLPRQWADQVVEPIGFDHYSDYEILSERVLGYEYEDCPCYCEHYFVLTNLRSDDDETYYLAPGYWEHLVAWRLRDGRWLIHRRISCNEDCDQHQSFFSFANEMPR